MTDLHSVISPIINQCKITDPASFKLADHPTRVDRVTTKGEVKAFTRQNAKDISDLAHAFYAEKKQGLILVLQGMDTSGKDGSTASCFDETPPLNLHMAAFKSPSKNELAHDYLWRVHPHCPPLGHISIFNRSHYEEVLIAKVRELAPAEQIEQRYEQINGFEKHLVQNGTHIIKCMLNISYEVQGERLRDRLETPRKRWKFNPADLDDRKLWPDYMEAYETMIRRTSTQHAPWYVVPSDSRSRRGAIISAIVRNTLVGLDPQYPDPGYRLSDFEIE